MLLTGQKTTDGLDSLPVGDTNAMASPPLVASNFQQGGRGRGPNAYLISNQRIVGRSNGSSVYVLNIMDYLESMGYRVHYVSPSPATVGRWAVMRLMPEVRLFSSYRVRGTIRFGDLLFSTSPIVYLQAALAVLCRLGSRLGFSIPQGKPAPYSIAIPLSEADGAFLRDLECRPGDLVVLDYVFLTAALDHISGARVPRLLIMHDLFSSRSAQFERIGRVDAIATMSFHDELVLLAKADLILAIQRDEARLVEQHLPKHRVVVVPMAVAAAETEHVGDSDSVLFVGSMAGPNVDGLQWFLAEVWPLVKQVRAEARLDVVGSVCHHLKENIQAVSLHGVVPDLAPFYRNAGIVVSPLRVGSGLKIKLVEAMAWGKAIVASTVTLQGVEDIAAGAVCVRDDAAGFAAAICDLMADKTGRRALAMRARDVAKRNFSAAVCHAPIGKFLEQFPVAQS